MNNPTALYIHIPFCHSICHYCDFPKLQYFSKFVHDYLIKLKEELDSYHIQTPLKTIYVGGGTPTSLSEEELESLLKIIKPYSSKVLEYTFEANPESLTERKLLLLKSYGVNRLSIGIESSNDQILKLMNRQYTFREAMQVIQKARKIGFNNINVDLIIGLPHVSMEMLNRDIDNLLKLHPEHISCYSLTVHPHTQFYINKIKPKNDDQMREMYDLIHQKLEKCGYIHYEVSNFAQENYESQHNLVYWNNEPYYGIGLGASGYIKNIRYTNTKSINEYLKGQFVKEKETLTLKDERQYFIMLNLRKNSGIDLIQYQNKFHSNLLLDYQNEIEMNIKLGFLKLSLDHTHLVPTYEGMMVLDQIILSLF